MSKAKGMAHVVDDLASKHEVMISNSSTATTKKLVKQLKMAVLKPNTSVTDCRG
jgi:hypothetical protein